MGSPSTDPWFITEMVGYGLWLILIPISIYGNITMYSSNNDEMFIQKRSPSILYGLNMSLICAMIALSLSQLAVMYSNLYIQLLSFVLFFAVWWFFLLFLITKNWMIFFKYNWTKYTLQSQWQNIINPVHASNNWYIKNNTKYGNLTYIYKSLGTLCLFAFIFNSAAATLCVLTNFELYALIIGAIVIMSVYSPAIMFYIYVVWKTPDTNDIFHIHWESKLHSKILLILCIFWNGFNVMIIFVGIKSVVIAFPIISIFLFSLNYVSTFIIIKKNKFIKNSLKVRLSLNTSSMASTPSSGTTLTPVPALRDNESDVALKKPDSSHLRLNMLLENDDAFHLFMLHLSREFCFPCFLFFFPIF